MIRSKLIAAALGLTLALPVVPALAAWRCSIHPPKTASDAELRSMAKVSKSRAESIALGRVGHGAQISSAEIEAEQGCLIWSFDLKVPGRKGVQEVNIDAGNGKVLGVHHESAGSEASEG
ncbi:MAG: PepSY domain-containing protein [Gammaproteobacteria bacterium]|nr:PepSY domain-containing protein [Gammaproteobacteria bacterium]